MPALAVVLDVERDGFRAIGDLACELGLDPRTPASELLESGKLIHLSNDAHIELGALTAGTSSGAPSVAFCFKLPDGQVAVVESTLRLLLTAADTLKARYGDPR